MESPPTYTQTETDTHTRAKTVHSVTSDVRRLRNTFTYLLTCNDYSAGNAAG